MSKTDIERTEAFYEKAIERGANVQTFTCSCGHMNKDLAPTSDNEVWDSMTFCPNCDKAYFKKVSKTGCEVEEL